MASFVEGNAVPHLFRPLILRKLRLRNRIVVSPMCQYASRDGLASDWHLVHLGKFAQGGAALVFTESTAVEERGRITHGDLGIWSDEQIAGLRRITEFIRAQGAVAGIQLSHAGRKAATQRPWHGNGPLGEVDLAERGERSWPIQAPSAIAVGEGWLKPAALDANGLESLRASWRAAAQRALLAGFQAVEVHCAHGYLLHQFLSPLTNNREDAYGGSLQNRMRFPLEVIESVREVWPAELPVFVRISAVDGLEGGWGLDDSIAFSAEAKRRGVDVIDCSSGGLIRPAMASYAIKPAVGYQVPYAEQVRSRVGLTTMAVGLIFDPDYAESVLEQGRADLIAIARGALDDPNWPLHAAQALGYRSFDGLPEIYSFFLGRRRQILSDLAKPSTAVASRQ